MVWRVHLQVWIAQSRILRAFHLHLHLRFGSMAWLGLWIDFGFCFVLTPSRITESGFSYCVVVSSVPILIVVITRLECNVTNTGALSLS